jgi:ankyrin repeat protein
VKTLFRGIRSGDTAAVAALLDGNPGLVNAVAKAPPKKDDGQSALQVAIKSGQFDIAQLLIDRGADVNFMDRSELNRWNVPVLHDAIRAAVFSSRFGRNRALPGTPAQIEVMNTAEQFSRAFEILNAIVARGADLRARDSVGNPALMRAVLDARQVIDEPILPELYDDLHRVFDLLLVAGADPKWIDPRFGWSIADAVEGEPVRQFLRLA